MVCSIFTKAHRYQAISWDFLDFTRNGPRGWTEAVLNVVYFIPLGSLYGLRAKPAEFIFLSLVTITGVETIQYVFYVGTFALSDILLNFFGGGFYNELSHLVK
ncbi:VanZ family protein [Enterococcus faecium]|uniref:VanZ family protein n=1 Tax=Enterococcus faecium TaxID=1352 RepID=UPI00296B166A|nr:VanZ family protein [Enterococcus faecium]MDW3710251.1 VanZ family protein [Enterococcus faecium]